MRSLRFLMLTAMCLLPACAITPATPQASVVGAISEDFLFSLDRVEHAHVDLDHDGTDEWFLGSSSTRGNAGLSFLVLKRDGEAWRPMGEIFVNPYAFRVLPLGPDGGIRLLRYYRLGGSVGSIDTLTYRDGEFVVLESETIHPGDSGTEEGRRRLGHAFSDDMQPGERLRLTGDGGSR